MGRYEEAIESYDNVIEISSPDYALGAWIDKGDILKKIGRYEEAIKAYDKAIEIYPNNSYALESKGLALEALGRNSEANAAFSEAKMLMHQS